MRSAHNLGCVAHQDHSGCQAAAKLCRKAVWRITGTTSTTGPRAASSSSWPTRSPQGRLRRPVTLLELDQPINVATIGDRFAFLMRTYPGRTGPRPPANLVLPG